MKVLLREIHRVPVHVQRERLQPHATQLHNSVVRLDNAYPIGVPKYSGMYMLCDYRVESDGLGVTRQSCGWVLCFSAVQLNWCCRTDLVQPMRRKITAKHNKRRRMVNLQR